MRREVKVLPVPQAMMSLPRSAAASPSVTAASARRWCSRRLLRPTRTMTSGVSRLKESQSIVELNRSPRPMRDTGTTWLAIVWAAAGFQRSVVETNRREVNSPVPDSARKVSTSFFVTVCSGS